MPGTPLDVLVLAPGRRGCLGVDLASGAFVRVHQRGMQHEPLNILDVGTTFIADVQQERPDQPESVDVTSPLERVGRLGRHRQERLLRQLVHPAQHQLFGFHGSSIASWRLDGERPSVGLVQPGDDLQVSVGERGVRCQFSWNGLPQDLAFEDPRLLARLDWLTAKALRGRQLRDALGFRPGRLVVALSRPVNGHCYKIAAAALPRL